MRLQLAKAIGHSLPLHPHETKLHPSQMDMFKTLVPDALRVQMNEDKVRCEDLLCIIESVFYTLIAFRVFELASLLSVQSTTAIAWCTLGSSMWSRIWWSVDISSGRVYLVTWLLDLLPVLFSSLLLQFLQPFLILSLVWTISFLLQGSWPLVQIFHSLSSNFAPKTQCLPNVWVQKWKSVESHAASSL